MAKYLALIAGMALLIWFLYAWRTNDTADSLQIESASSTIVFPQGGEMLKQGEVYTLSWTGGPDPIHIFLIDASLEDQGASVSIVDRVYGIQNKHAYNYAIPTSTKLGNYQFQIGSETSGVFRVVAP